MDDWRGRRDRDLVVLRGQPDRDVTAIRTVERVIVAGQWVDTAKYRQY